MTCPTCERYKQSASMWRNKAYELNGTPLPWKPDELWVGLTDEELQYAFRMNSVMVDNGNSYMVAGLRAVNIARAIEAKLKEKNT